jgi:hypothetical protein
VQTIGGGRCKRGGRFEGHHRFIDVGLRMDSDGRERSGGDADVETVQSSDGTRDFLSLATHPP